MKNYKVLFVGSPGSGKTTAIRSLSEIDVVDTDANVSDAVIQRKRTTTVGMDYGRLQLNDNATLQMYGTPGQERFKFMWDLMMTDLAADANALILLVDNTRNYPFKDIDFYLSEFWDYIVQRHFVIAVTRSDLDDSPSEADYLNRMKEKGIFAPVTFIDARKSMHVLDLVASAIRHDADDVDWSDVSYKVAMQEFERRNPEPGSAQFEWLLRTKDVPKISSTDAAMNVHGVLGASQFDSAGKMIGTTIGNPDYHQLFDRLQTTAQQIEANDTELVIKSLSLHGSNQDSVSLFREHDQGLGLVSKPNLSVTQVRNQADDIMQWSEHVSVT